MRILLVALGFFLSIVSASIADERPCPAGIELSVTSAGESVLVRWRAEPAGTASRVVMAVGPDGKVKAEQSRTARKRLELRAGDYTVIVGFYDTAGNVICTGSTTVSVKRGFGLPEMGTSSSNSPVADTPKPAAPVAAAPTPPPAAPLPVIVKGRLIVVFVGSSYVGVADRSVAGSTYDGRTEDMTNYLGIDVYGNNDPNIIYGSSLDDVIYGYAGNDEIYGGDGDDEIHGGDEKCTGFLCVGVGSRLGDKIEGGKGNDTIYGGNEECSNNDTFYPDFFGCNREARVGDLIDGGEGDDTIYGGDEYCSGDVCNYSGSLGDKINGGKGNDHIEGGAGNCTNNSQSCNYLGQIGNPIEGGDGDDQIEGGRQECVGNNCNVSGHIGNQINGGDGNDDITGGDASCNSPCIAPYGSNANVIDGGAGDDVIVGGASPGDKMTGGPGSDTIDGVVHPDIDDPIIQ